MKVESTARLVLLALASLSAANGLVIPQHEVSALEQVSDIAEIQSLFAGKSDKDLVEIVMNYITSANDVAITSKSASPVVEFNMAPVIDASSAKKESLVIDNKYIVVLKKSISKAVIDFNKELVQQLQLQSFKNLSEDDQKLFLDSDKEYEFGVENKLSFGIADDFNVGELLNGFIGYFTPQVIDLIRMLPIVDYIEKDSMVFTQDFQVENGAPWGLARISHRDKLSLGSFNKYLYDSEGGEGVTAYVVDTGINVEHDNFEGRAVWGKTIPLNDADIDGNGHGTHCAGTIGSTTYGVAKKAEIVAVKVLRSDGSGSMSDVVKGVEFVANDHIKNGKGRKASTANMSLGGGNSPTLDMAVNAAVEAGIHFAVAAGNEDQDACNSSPASAANPITVGASTLADDRAYFSNWGKCVDIFAPGLNILSTYIGSKSATAVLSGTSMASPHVCGLLTYFLSLQPGADSAFAEGKIEITPAFMKAKLIEFGTKGALSDIDVNTPNVLIFNGAGEDLASFWQSPENETLAAAEAPKHHGLSLENIVDSIVSEVEHFGLDSVRDAVKQLL